MRNLNFILEQINGSTSILTFFFLCWSSWYLWEFFEYRGTYSWRTVFVGLPPAIGLALILYLDKIGTLLTRATVWVWRATSGGTVPFTDEQTVFLLMGAVLTEVSILLLIRKLSHPRLGEWPWISSGIIAGAYVLVSILVHNM